MTTFIEEKNMQKYCKGIIPPKMFAPTKSEYYPNADFQLCAGTFVLQ